MNKRGPGQAEFRIVLNPTGDRFGVTWMAEAKSKSQVWQIVDWMRADMDSVSTDWRISVNDSPLFGAEHADSYLSVTREGYTGRWAEEALTRR